MKLVVGLGNPGAKYEKTRHNIGFRILNQLAQDLTWRQDSKWQIANRRQETGDRRQEDVLYIKPLTFMNNSGEAVRAVMNYYHITLPEILVVFDDKDLPLGTIRFRSKGSSGGHNGIKSIIAHIGSEEFARFKVGIAPTETDRTISDTADYVLSKFSKDEQKLLPEIIEQVVEKVQSWV